MFCDLGEYMLTSFAQNALLAVTNTNEGLIFVNQTDVVNTSTYAGQIFPKFGPVQDAEVAKQYAGVGSTTLDQIIAIMGDCKLNNSCSSRCPYSYSFAAAIFKCPSYFLMNAFHQKNLNAFKVCSPCGHAFLSNIGFNRENLVCFAYVPRLHDV